VYASAVIFLPRAMAPSAAAVELNCIAAAITTEGADG